MKFEFKKSDVILLIVDMQKLFTLPSSPYGNDASDMIQPINDLSTAARRNGIPVVHSTYQLAKDGSQTGLRTDWPQITDGYFDHTSDWSQVDDRIIIGNSDHRISRTRPGALHEGDLEALMKKLGKTQMIICGLSTNYAISFTVHEAFSRDIPTFLVDDLSNMTAFENREQREFLHTTLDMWACELTTRDSIIASMAA